MEYAHTAHNRAVKGEKINFPLNNHSNSGVPRR
jgi:hypothetical protein